MSLFGARKTSTFQRAKERLDKMLAEESTGSQTSSSGIGAVLDRHLDAITGPLSSDGEMATTSEIAHELSQLDREDKLRQFHGTQEYEVLKAGEEQDKFQTGLHQA